MAASRLSSSRYRYRRQHMMVSLRIYGAGRDLFSPAAEGNIFGHWQVAEGLARDVAAWLLFLCFL